jgi:parallel beta-helix repeat protein
VSRKLVLALALTLLVGMLSVAFNVQRAKASGTIYIRADGSIDPPAAPILSVDNITYTFADNIYLGSYDSVVVERDNIILDGSGYTLQGTGFVLSKGIDISGRRQVTIQSLEIRNFGYGIVLEDSSNNTILGTNIANNTEGIRLSHGSSNNTIAGNNITANNNVGVWLYSDSLTISGNNNTISGNNITNNEYGIFLERSSDSTIAGNNITNNSDFGIYLDESYSNTFSGNNITANFWGIVLRDSSNNTILGNNITANNRYGINLHGSNNTMLENNITANNDGIEISSSNNSISGNNITNNSESGIRLSESSNYNSINGNNITNNNVGVYLSALARANKFWHNNFIDNTQQVNVQTGIYPNGTLLIPLCIWDDGYPSGGNYWSDYGGTDVNQDGIGDTSYIIDANNTDHYPLMVPYVIPEFPSFLIPMLFMIATLLAVIVYRRRISK